MVWAPILCTQLLSWFHTFQHLSYFSILVLILNHMHFPLFRSWGNYLEERTSETYSHRYNETLHFPSVTLCPTFKDGKNGANRFSVTQTKFPSSMQSLGLLDFSHMLADRYPVSYSSPLVFRLIDLNCQECNKR